MNLNGKTFRVITTAAQGVVSENTRLVFAQRDLRVIGRYSGGSIARGRLVGTLAGDRLYFSYAQREADGHIHGGQSECSLHYSRAGRLRLIEHFRWGTRVGSGTNVFEEVVLER